MQTWDSLSEMIKIREKENEKMFRINAKEETLLMSLYVIKACVQKH